MSATKAKKSIEEIGKPWRYHETPTGICGCVEIDEHLTNFRPSTRADESTVFADVLVSVNGDRYIKYKRHTYYL